MARRTAQFIEEQKSAKAPKKRGPKPGTKPHPNSAKNLKPPWPKGFTPNPGGLPGTDLAAKYARELFERHPEGISKPMMAELKGFNAYAYNVLADRAYGKLKEKLEVSGDEELLKRLLAGRNRLKGGNVA